MVATGIDNTGVVRHAQPAESALRELAGKIRNDSRRIADRIERSAPATAHAAPSVESAAHAAVAAAILPPTAIEDVSIRPMPIKPSLFETAHAEAPAAEPQMPAAFIPPAPER